MTSRTDARHALKLQAPARLHLGFLDPAGTLGRRFGSIGLVVDGFETTVVMGLSNATEVTGDTPAARAEAGRAAGYLEALQQRTQHREPVSLRLLDVLPAHAGFGSGTQLALAVGRAFAQLHGLDVDTAQLARWLGRGLRSGVGIAGFDQGGLLVDGGPGLDGVPAPLVSRIAFPPAWRIVLVMDPRGEGLSGGDEREAIATLPPLPQAVAADICHQVLMRILPGAATGAFAPFATGLRRVQQLLGEHFAPAQAGSAFTSAAVGRLVEWIGGATGAAIGQSSWGPTGFAVLPSEAEARACLAAAQGAGVVDPALEVHIVRGRNHGAHITDARFDGASRH
jgi:beta-ribofuranosylaminobenzene 5'-phosphate synthase